MSAHIRQCCCSAVISATKQKSMWEQQQVDYIIKSVQVWETSKTFKNITTSSDDGHLNFVGAVTIESYNKHTHASPHITVVSSRFSSPLYRRSHVSESSRPSFNFFWTRKNFNTCDDHLPVLCPYWISCNVYSDL